MKVLCGFVLIAAVALVQGRNAPSRVAAGTPASEPKPYIVHLRYVTPTGQLETCAGAVIDNRWILTSASGISTARFIWIRFGALSVSAPELVIESSRITVHPAFNTVTFDNDLALLDLNRPVEYTTNIRPVRLETSDEANEDISGHETSFCAYGVTEYNNGLSEELICADVVTADSVACTSSLTSADMLGNIVCAVGPGACSGDSGAPLVVSDGDDFKLVGVLSSWPSVCSDTVPFSGAFYRPGKYISWIEEATGLTLDNSVSKKTDFERVQVAQL